MARWLLALPLLAVIGAPESAWALKPSTHRELAEVACARVGLPDAFCRRMGKQTFETDDLEWDDLSAHAQRELGQDRCEAADAALARVDSLAASMVTRARAGRFEEAAVALGRALHTIQDECAHHGMTNQEHAFYTLTEQCTDADVSPDSQPAALRCAQTRTTAVMEFVATALANVQWNGVHDLCTDYRGDNPSDACANASLPSPFDACDFLAEHKHWDGLDSTWDPTLVGDELVKSFRAGLAGQVATRSACGGDPNAIDPPHPHAPVHDRAGLGCFATSLGCLGKVDEDSSAPEATAAGCAATSPSTLLGPSILLGLGAAFLPRRRRRDRRPERA